MHNKIKAKSCVDEMQMWQELMVTNFYAFLIDDE